jgi:hypothetical protein
MDSGIGLLQIEDCPDAEVGVTLPRGVMLISLIDRNIANVGDATAYRYLDHTAANDVHTEEVTIRRTSRPPPRRPRPLYGVAMRRRSRYRPTAAATGW